ncbi:cytochrome c [Fulvivirga sp. RKSG066]|uniref:c-type cytochrome n=1 Tax=Fulvivirga aurantia TaxID=2529383 RepID=UPI0012BC681D|nr:cytochrome c [Fulvivirga aurantia]MTI21301.1 cytochrome c [Fulvivirga aurantia]
MKIRILIIAFIGFTAISAIKISNAQNDDLKASMQRGADIYAINCSNCHMSNGKGVPGAFPPLAQSDYLMADLDRAIKQILYGANGEMTVNGVVYNGVMTAFPFSNKETADVLNYIRNSWGNEGDIVKPDDVEKARKK